MPAELFNDETHEMCTSENYIDCTQEEAIEVMDRLPDMLESKDQVEKRYFNESTDDAGTIYWEQRSEQDERRSGHTLDGLLTVFISNSTGKVYLHQGEIKYSNGIVYDKREYFEKMLATLRERRHTASKLGLEHEEHLDAVNALVQWFEARIVELYNEHDENNLMTGNPTITVKVSNPEKNASSEDTRSIDQLKKAYSKDD